MKKLIFLLISLVLLTTFMSCVQESGYMPNQSAVAYGFTHGGYVGKAEVTVDGEGNLSVFIDEAFLPHTLAVVDIDADGWNDENTTSFLSRGNPGYVAKYVEYNGKIYVGVEVGTGFSYVEADESGVAVGNTDLEMAILRNQDTMATFYASIPAGKFKILSGFGGTARAITTTTYGGVTKKGSPDYWSSGQTWVGNITAIENFISINGLQFAHSDMVREEEPNEDGLNIWTVEDAVTGATNNDFKDYFGLAQAAAGRLKAY